MLILGQPPRCESLALQDRIFAPLTAPILLLTRRQTHT